MAFHNINSYFTTLTSD